MIWQNAGPHGAAEGCIANSSCMSGAGNGVRPRGPGTRKGSLSVPEVRRCRGLECQGRVHDGACVSFASRDDDPGFAMSNPWWNADTGMSDATTHTGSSFFVAGADVNEDTDEIEFDELEGESDQMDLVEVSPE